jgi:hypothetical protein
LKNVVRMLSPDVPKMCPAVIISVEIVSLFLHTI